MRSPYLQKRYTCFILGMIVLMTASSFGFPNMSKKEPFKGPWEFAAKIGPESPGLVLPLEIEDRDKVQALGKAMTLPGTPIVVSLKNYFPDVAWEEKIVEDPNGGPIALVTIDGKDLHKDMMLISGDTKRRSITSTIGGVAIRKINRDDNVEEVLKKIAEQKAVGVLTVQLEDKTVDVIVSKNGEVKIPGTNYVVKVLEYLHHYSVDRETKKVQNASPLPVNPAIKISLSDGKKDYEKWLWSMFEISPHDTGKLPVNIAFNDFDLADSEGRYIIVNDGEDTWIYYLKDGKTVIEKASMGTVFPFKDTDYSFTLNKVVKKGAIKKSWSNKSEKLSNPAIIAEIAYDGRTSENLVSFNKPTNIKTEHGTLVLNYRQKASMGQVK